MDGFKLEFADIDTEVNFWLSMKGYIVAINNRDFRIEDTNLNDPAGLMVVPSSGEEGDEGPGELVEFSDIETVYVY